MASRLDLQTLLVGLGWPHVYYSPPSNTKMEYPCIRYELDGEYRENASNKAYVKHKRYQIMAISKDPDDPLFESFDDIPLCSLVRAYRVGSLHHQIFDIYF